MHRHGGAQTPQQLLTRRYPPSTQPDSLTFLRRAAHL